MHQKRTEKLLFKHQQLVHQMVEGHVQVSTFSSFSLPRLETRLLHPQKASKKTSLTNFSNIK